MLALRFHGITGKIELRIAQNCGNNRLMVHTGVDLRHLVGLVRNLDLSSSLVVFKNFAPRFLEWRIVCGNASVSELFSCISRVSYRTKYGTVNNSILRNIDRNHYSIIHIVSFIYFNRWMFSKILII